MHFVHVKICQINKLFIRQDILSFGRCPHVKYRQSKPRSSASPSLRSPLPPNGLRPVGRGIPLGPGLGVLRVSDGRFALGKGFPRSVQLVRSGIWLARPSAYQIPSLLDLGLRQQASPPSEATQGPT